MAVYINDYKISEYNIGIINNTGLLAAYEWARDSGRDVRIEFTRGDYNDLVLSSNYIENRAEPCNEIMAHIWFHHPEYINGTPEIDYIYDLIATHGKNPHIEKILTDEAMKTNFTAPLESVKTDGVSAFKFGCRRELLSYMDSLDFYGYITAIEEHLVDYDMGEYLYIPEAKIADVENSELMKNLTWLQIIDMVEKDCDFSEARCRKMFQLASKYKMWIPVIGYCLNNHGHDDEVYIYIGYLKLCKKGETVDRRIRNKIIDIKHDEDVYIQDNNHYVISKFYMQCIYILTITGGFCILFSVIAVIILFVYGPILLAKYAR